MSGCSYEIDSSLEPYVRRFKRYSDDYGHLWPPHLSVVFGDLGGKPAECREIPWSSAVVVDKDYWSGAKEYQREFTMFHELGHCVLYIGHSGHDVSYMSDSLKIDESVYWEARDFMLYELFVGEGGR